MKRTSLLILCSIFFVPVYGGVVYEVETKDHKDSKTYQTKISAQGRNLTMNIEKGEKGGGDMIFHGESHEMLVVDHARKSYMVMDKASIDQIAGQVSGAMSQMQEAMKNIPEGQRAMMEKMMKQRMPQAQPEKPKSKLVRNGEKKKINGYPCVRYDVVREGHKIREHWVTEWKHMEGAEDAAQAFKEMGSFVKDLMASISKMAGSMGSLGDSDNMFGHLDEMNGFPVSTRNYDGNGTLESESQLRSAKRQTIDPDTFEPPSGYKRQSMGM